MLQIKIIDSATLKELGVVRSHVSLVKGDTVNLQSPYSAHMYTGEVESTGYSASGGHSPANHLVQFVLLGDVVKTSHKDLVENAEDVARRWEKEANADVHS